MPQEELVIHKIFSHTVSLFPDSVALQVEKDNRWLRITYKELETASQKVAALLIRNGLQKGERAGLILENRPEWVMIYLGIVSAGLTCVPIDRQLSWQEIKNLILDSAASIVFCSYSVFAEKLKDGLEDDSPLFVILDNAGQQNAKIINFSEIERIAPDISSMPSVAAEDIASLIYTSGTTALPKGVLLSHKNICSNFKGIQKLNIYFPSDNAVSLLPLHHTYAFMVTLIVPLFLGAKVTYCPSLKSQDLMRVIKETQVTILTGVPQLFSLLHKAIYDQIKKIPFFLRFLLLPLIRQKVRRRFGDLRLLVSGGARLEPKINRDLTKLGLKLIEGYGLTETSPVVTLNPPQKVKFGSVGKPIPGVEIKINHPDSSGIGEVLIRGPNVMQGYFKHPELTKEVIKEGWFYSGDLGRIDKEGYVFLTGRQKDVIVLSSGKNIYPEELEGYYSGIPSIKEICILSRKEEKFGRWIESLYAVIVPDLEFFRQKKEADIRGKIRWELENLSRKLPSYQHIMGFVITKEELPRTALKKIKRYEVKKKYLEVGSLQAEAAQEMVLSEEDKKLIHSETAKKIINYICGELKKPVDLESHLEIDLGIDSLSRVELGLGLGASLNIDIPDELLYSVSTVREVIINIQNLAEKGSATAYKAEAVQKNWGQILQDLPSPEKMREKVRISPGFLDKLVTLILKTGLLFTFRIFWRLGIKGKESLPRHGPYIICPNHASYLDGFVVFVSMPLRNAVNTFFLGYSDIFEHPSISWGNKIARFIPVDPSLHLTAALQYTAFVLLHKKIVCLFPEGRRSIDENPGEFKKGVGVLIKELDIPVVPVYIKGSHYSWPRGSRLPRFYPLQIIFGQPLSRRVLLESRQGESALDEYEIIARRLREKVGELAC